MLNHHERFIKMPGQRLIFQLQSLGALLVRRELVAKAMFLFPDVDSSLSTR
jgi:hypothetical protein